MRKIEYIFIDSDCQANDSKSSHHALPNFGYHFVVNSQGLVSMRPNLGPHYLKGLAVTSLSENLE